MHGAFLLMIPVVTILQQGNHIFFGMNISDMLIQVQIKLLLGGAICVDTSDHLWPFSR